MPKIKNMIAVVATLTCLSTPAFAEMPQDTSTKVMGATKMGCKELDSEMKRLNQIVTAAGDAKVNDTATGAVAAAGTQAAILSGAGSSIPFIGGAFNVAKSVTSANAANKEELAKEAKTEVSRLSGIAEVKGCM